MIDRFADWFAGVLLEKGVITEDELEVCWQKSSPTHCFSRY